MNPDQVRDANNAVFYRSRGKRLQQQCCYKLIKRTDVLEQSDTVLVKVGTNPTGVHGVSMSP